MGSTKERVEQRRQYLKKKGWAYSLMTGGSIIFASAAFASSICFIGMCVLFAFGPKSLFAIVFAVASLVFSLFAWSGWRTIKRGRQAMQIPYIPPVTPDTLPAEEVLVRGSEEPAQEQSKVLLRGTDGSAGTGEQELLRGSQGQEQGK